MMTGNQSSSTQNNAIEVNQLRFGYDVSKPLITIDNWHVAQGDNVFLYGASGSGKSTLLNLLSGILTPQTGEINLLGKGFSSLSSSKRDAFRAKNIGVVFQEFNLIPFLTVAENIEIATHFAKSTYATIRPHFKKKDVKQRMVEIFERLQLSKDLLTHRADSLSVGQRQRVSIARSLINQPEILIADEPTSALDSDNRDEFMQLLLETAHGNTNNDTKCTVLFVSHDRGLAQHFDNLIDIEKLLNS